MLVVQRLSSSKMDPAAQVQILNEVQSIISLLSYE